MQRKTYRNTVRHGNHVALAEEYFGLFTVFVRKVEKQGVLKKD